jgi:signal transduction histidine kinase
MTFTIRTRLLLLVLAVLLPGLVGVIWLINNASATERSAQERLLRDGARALAMVVDRELSQRTVVARVLAQSRWLDGAPALTAEQVRGFEVLARRALLDVDGWLELRVPGSVLLDTRRPSGAAPRPLAEALVSQAQVQPLQMPVGNDEAHAAVVVPRLQGDQPVLNVVLTLRPSELQRIIDAQQLPAGWLAAVLDNRGTVVARHPGGDQHLGRQANPDVKALIAGGREGSFESTSLEGQDTLVYYSRSPQGWSYFSAMPRPRVAGLLPMPVLQVAVLSLLLLALAVFGTLWMSRRITAPVRALKLAAQQMQAGQPVRATATGIAECDEVARALAEAAQAIRGAQADLQAQVAAAVQRTRLAEQRVAKGQRVEALGRLTGGVAHDFNNLLGVISNSAHLIERHPAAGELQAPLQVLWRAVQMGSQLTQHLLRIAGRQPLRPQRLALERWLPEQLDMLRSVLGRHITVKVQVAPGTAPVQVDAGELELALINLGLNARDVMHGAGELRVVARAADAEESEGLAGAPQRGYVQIAVGDDGGGMAPELAAQVFEPFFTTKPVGQGAGLGLSQVHGFCVQAGGTARVASTPGLGTTVTMLLPASEGEVEEAVPADSDRPAASIKGARVLLVEDNETLGDVTAAVLAAHGAQVQRASDALQALQWVAAQGLPDVVLSDVVMPGRLDGLALARELRRLHPTLPVLLISGYNTAAAQSEFRVLRKPCPQPELLGALHQALGAAPACGRR